MISTVYFGHKRAYPERYFSAMMNSRGEAVYRTPLDEFQVWHVDGTRVIYVGIDPSYFEDFDDHKTRPCSLFVHISVQGDRDSVRAIEDLIRSAPFKER